MKCAISGLFFAAVLAANVFSQNPGGTAYVPVIVNAEATVSIQPNFDSDGTGDTKSVAADAEETLAIQLSENDRTPTLRQNQAKPASFRYSRGSVFLELPSQQFRNADISLFSLNGKRILHGKAQDASGISQANVTEGIYFLLVKGASGFSARFMHAGGALNINAAFSGEKLSPAMKPGDYGTWTITAKAEGYYDYSEEFEPEVGDNPLQTIVLTRIGESSSSRLSSSSRAGSSSSVAGSSSSRASSSSAAGSSSSRASSSSGTFVPLKKENYKETIGNVSFDMVYIPGGTFTIGCEKSSGCPADATPVSDVRVSNYFIGKAEVTIGLWNAVMGTGTCTVYGTSTSSYTNMTWYDAMEFACKLSQLTGKNYRMATEAEWEYAAKNHVSGLSNIGSGEEWAYNSWNSTHAGGTDPLGPGSGLHTQKTRRDAQGTADNITGRLIRSIEGMGPALRLVVSADVSFPPGYVAPCDLHAPQMGDEPVNSYRDLRWVTGSDIRWEPAGTIAIGGFTYNIWEDGTALMTPQQQYCYGSSCNPVPGQWFTSNNIAFVFVPSSGSLRKYAYIFLDETQGSLISGDGFTNGYIGRIEKKSASSVAKPTVSGLKSGKELADAAGVDYKMVNMANIPQTAMQKDSRLLDGTSQGWFQDNTSSGGVHHYRKDVDNDEFRFTVNQGTSRTMLANGTWFTVNNTFLRVTHKDGYTADYLYAVDSEGTFYHNSFMAYERGDFRMFKKKPNGGSWPCGSICSDEIPKNEAASMYDRMCNGHSTFTPAPCPAGGCN